MLIDKIVKIKWCGVNKKYYQNKGYIFTNFGDEFCVKVEDLSLGTKVIVNIKCDNCNKNLFISWKNYKKYIKDDEKYYCCNCSHKLYANKSMQLTVLKNSISFGQWCVDNIDKNFVEKYWSDKNTLNPFEISYKSNKNVWIKCQEKDYHEDYEIHCYNFIDGNRCPYCSNRHGKVHKLDSIGSLFPEIFNIWSDKNKKSPYEYSIQSNESVWWKCTNGKHNDYLRNIENSYHCDFRCPSCQFSKGEQKVEDYLIYNNITYEPQKTFDGLTGINDGLLSYDFYLSDYNMLIEYQGQFHDGNGNYYIKQNLNIQQEHDKRKKEYALSNDIKLLEIWYWDFDNIYEILKNEIK